MSGGQLETGNHVEAVYYYKENRNVYYLKEVSLLSPPFAGRDSLPHAATRLSAMELLDQVCYPGSADETIVDVAVEYVRVEGEADPLLVFLAFELRLLAALGAFPDLTGCAGCGEEVRDGAYDARGGVVFCQHHAQTVPDALPLSAQVLAAIQLCVAVPLPELIEAGVEERTRKQLGKLVHWTYTYHVQGYSLPKSLSLI
jgi:recombinational DNA repair protein (RecF pathway)